VKRDSFTHQINKKCGIYQYQSRIADEKSDKTIFYPHQEKKKNDDG
jgi:hypothetical protein